MSQKKAELPHHRWLVPFLLNVLTLRRFVGLFEVNVEAGSRRGLAVLLRYVWKRAGPARSSRVFSCSEGFTMVAFHMRHERHFMSVRVV